MPYQQSQVVHWLSWLAQQLTRHSQTEFFIERMQPDWLSEQKEQRVYERLGVRLPGVLIGIAIGPIVWIAASSINDIGIANSLYYIILMALIGGLIGGLFSENGSGQRFEREGTNYVLEDLGTPNGTFVNDQRIQRHTLASGDAIRLGDAVFTSRVPVAE